MMLSKKERKIVYLNCAQIYPETLEGNTATY